MADCTTHVAHGVNDPSDMLPEDLLGFRFVPEGVEVCEVCEVTRVVREVVITWPWADVIDANGFHDSTDPTDMELVAIEVQGVGQVQVECNDCAQLAGAFQEAKARYGTRCAQGQAQAPAVTLDLPGTLDVGAPVEAEVAAHHRKASVGHDLGRAGNTTLIGEGGPVRSLVVIVGYVILAYVCFRFVLDEQVGEGGTSLTGGGRRWTFVDSIYFSITTITTVGYGDLHPTTPLSRLFTSIFALVGVIGVGMALGVVTQYIVDKSEEKKQRTMDSFLRQSHLQTSTTGKTVLRRKYSEESRRNLRAKREQAALFSRRTRLLRKLCCVRKRLNVSHALKLMRAAAPLAVALLAGLLFCPIEGMTPQTALYMSSITITSVGFGDVSPKTQAGRLFSIFFIPLGVLSLFRTMTEITKLQVLARAGKITSVKQLLEMDNDGDGQVTCQEFQLFMLKAMGKVNASDLKFLEAQFEALDATGDGILSAADIQPEGEAAALRLRKVMV
jgi:potassium channel subfamily K, other eukaryote